MVALREHPAVAAGHDAELDPGRLRRTGCARARSTATFPSSATPRTIPSPSPADRATTPLAPSAPTRKRAPTTCEPTRAVTPASPSSTSLDGDSVAELCAGSRRLLREMEVEPPALRHLDERLRALPRSLAAVPDPNDHACRRRVRRPASTAHGRCLKRASGEPSAARLVARESRLVDEENAHPGPLEVDRRGRPGRSGTDDEDVEALHPAMVGVRRAAATIARRAGVPEWPKGAGCKPAGSAFGGSNPPPCIWRKIGIRECGFRSREDP